MDRRSELFPSDAGQDRYDNQWVQEMTATILKEGFPEDHRIVDVGTPAIVAQAKGSARFYPRESRRTVRARQHGPSL